MPQRVSSTIGIIVLLAVGLVILPFAALWMAHAALALALLAAIGASLWLTWRLWPVLLLLAVAVAADAWLPHDWLRPHHPAPAQHAAIVPGSLYGRRRRQACRTFLATLANCPKARSASIHDRCKAVFEGLAV
jgi:hypothetical protein